MKQKIIKIEFGKAIFNRWTLVSMTVSMVICVWSAIVMIMGYKYRIANLEYLKSDSGVYIKSPHLGMETAFNSWIGGEYASWTSTLFFFLVPLLASLPYSWSLFYEYKSGYVKNLFTRSQRKYYYLAKHIVTFIVGGLTVIIPMIINFIIILCFIPMRLPEPSEYMYYGVFARSMWSKIFYTYPVIYVLCYLFLNFIFAGLWATLTLEVGKCAKNKYSSIIVPYIVLLIFHFITSELLVWQLPLDITPINYIRATEITYPSNIWVIVLELTILALVIICVERRNEAADVL